MPNGSFEEYDDCPNNQGQVSLAIDWKEYGSSDYFNICATNSDFSIPYNWGGYQPAKDGNAYVGLCPYNDYVIGEREYIYVKLNKKLKIGEKYYISFFVNCTSSQYISASKYINNLGCLLTTFEPNNSLIIDRSTIYSKKIISDTINWIKISGVFTADSIYEYLSIGNFFNDIRTEKGSFFNAQQNVAYYFIDDVFLSEFNSDFLPNVFTPNKDGKNDFWGFDFENEVSCKIYNRWGYIIYEIKSNSIEWDGTNINNIDLPEGTYFYTIQTDNENFKGYIQVIM